MCAENVITFYREITRSCVEVIKRSRVEVIKRSREHMITCEHDSPAKTVIPYFGKSTVYNGFSEIAICIEPGRSGCAPLLGINYM